ncbi:lysylphosphatidylglycerol synthase transmembrane domain-containing protein [Bacillus sp. REN3]|uniref:lysylphosphatidylglycerol synthase transmembrane domain-containing protein n=1 Tax=Bacillus sp. REN3 TaxID=2802440 RepID=UPI001AEE0DFB|nr:lysylphosphatidylglycerol synthase transmembrane domain-containing protein [Bacillus sp. REN3]
MNHLSKKSLKRSIAAILIVSFLILTYYFLDPEEILSVIKVLLSDPLWLMLIFSGYFCAFLARGIAWRLYLRNRARLSTCMYGLFYSLLLNHLLPVKAGDFARIGILKMKEPGIPAGEAFGSVVIMRMLDTAMLFAMAVIGLVSLDLPVNSQAIYWMIGVAIAAILVFFTKFKHSMERQITMITNAFRGGRGFLIISLTFLSWILEAVVIYGVISKGTSEFDFVKAVWVNSITVAGQIFQITPGGIASYEAVMVFALGAVGIDVSAAYSAALVTHGIKYVFTFVFGGVALLAAPVSLDKLYKWMKERGDGK